MVRLSPETGEKTRPGISSCRDSASPCESHFHNQLSHVPYGNSRNRIIEAYFLNGQKGLTTFDCLLVFLGSADRDVRIAAVDTLGRLGDRRAVEPLFRACMDEDERVKEAALEALSNLGVKTR
jgi:hypothetical protein